MSKTYSFFVEGIPVTQGSKCLGRTKTGRNYMRDVNGTRLRDWRNTIAKTAIARKIECLTGPVELWCHFYLPRGKTVKREHPTVKPDLDKLMRAVGDALTNIAWADDAQIIDHHSSKRYAPDGATNLREGVWIDIVEM